MKDKFKNYSFWISVTGAVLLLVNNLGKIFGFNVNNEAVYSIVDGVCGVLVVFGVLTMNKSKKTTETKQDTSNEPADEQLAKTQSNIEQSTELQTTAELSKNQNTDKQSTKTTTANNDETVIKSENSKKS